MTESADLDPAGSPCHPALTAKLGHGQVVVTGRLLQASNATFLAEHSAGDDVIQCVYKPVRGEKPLWDFPRSTLALREVAAYEVSRIAGFDLVPVTVLMDGPVGLGSLQAWVETDQDLTDALVDLVPSEQLPMPGFFDVAEGLDARDRSVSVVHADDPRLRRMATFDALINNADRKGGHILASIDRVFGVDHGVTFNVDPKLRTLLWGFAGDPLAPDDRESVRRAVSVAPDQLTELLAPDEIEALVDRGSALLREGCLPYPHYGGHTIPWPPF